MAASSDELRLKCLELALTRGHSDADTLQAANRYWLFVNGSPLPAVDPPQAAPKAAGR